ncbi:hypothetical protein G6F24_014486 [Rhizopus arrhizus]|nr:hypothetical protein G6F24_014486 [Rhizopus arrhizus]
MAPVLRLECRGPLARNRQPPHLLLQPALGRAVTLAGRDLRRLRAGLGDQRVLRAGAARRARPDRADRHAAGNPGGRLRRVVGVRHPHCAARLGRHPGPHPADGRRRAPAGGLGMKNGFRQSMAWLHTWTGLLVGWLLLLIFMAGTASYYREEISRWMRPELPANKVSIDVAAQRAVDYLQANASQAENCWPIPAVAVAVALVMPRWTRTPARP